MEGNQPAFPPMNLVDVEVQRPAQFSADRELIPYVDRPPDQGWVECFYQVCEEVDDLDWKRAGFAHCRVEDVERVKGRLREVTERANDRFADFLARAESQYVARQLIELELISAASVGGEKYRVVLTI
jgi:hypothetical protein